MAIHVMANKLAAQTGGFEPQRTNNWSIQFIGVGGAEDDFSLALQSAFIPTSSSGAMPITFGNEIVYVAGRPQFEAGAVSVHDYVDRKVAKYILDWRKKVYDPTNGKVGLAVDYKKTGYVMLFGPNSGEGEATFERKWELRGCWPEGVQWSPLDMGSGGLMMLSMAIRYDKAIAP